MNNIIEIENLNILTQGNHIVKNFSLNIKKGEWISLKGPSGSGKSTVLKHFAQLNNPALEVTGSYKFEEKDIMTYDPVEIRKQISYCSQNPSLFDETVRENLEFPFKIRMQKFDENLAIKYLREVNLSDSFLNEKISVLSGGERQRIALIRNLLITPKVILLDEISSSLDTDTRNVVWDWIKNYQKENKTTIIMVTHIDEEHQMADKTIEVEKILNKNSNGDGKNE